MRRSMNIILAVVVTCGLILTFQQSMSAQVKSKQKSQWDMRKEKEIAQRTGDQTKRKIKAKDDMKSERTQISGVERYRAIIRNNLFMPLGSGGEVKQEGFILAGILGNSAFIQIEGSSKSFYVAEGQSFGNDVKLVQVGKNSVTIIYEGNKKELELISGALGSQGRGARGGRSRQRQKSSGKSGRETANRSGKERRSGGEKEGWYEGEKRGGGSNWARNMSMNDLSKARGEIERHIDGLKESGVTDPAEYRGAMEKMEAVDDAIAERGEEKD